MAKLLAGFGGNPANVVVDGIEHYLRRIIRRESVAKSAMVRSSLPLCHLAFVSSGLYVIWMIAVTVTYFKRYRMEIRLTDYRSEAILPAPFRLLSWSRRLMQFHAQAKWESFREEIDSQVFPCLGELEGCRKLMQEISERKDFVPGATWLVSRESEVSQAVIPLGTIQGLRSSAREGAIQNIGVHPDYRGQGLGRALIEAALGGFRAAGCHKAYLEVTVQNTAAIRLYERLGFRRVETLFKIAEVQYA